MSYAFDPEFLPAMEPWLPLLAARPVPKVGEYQVIRNNIKDLYGEAIGSLPFPSDVTQDRIPFTSYDGTELSILHSYPSAEVAAAKDKGEPQPAILHIHGGGMIGGSVDIFGTAIAMNASASGRQIFSVAYRLAPEHPYPVPPEDVYAGLKWLHANAAKFNVDPARIAVMGESAGGGLAASVALMAKERQLSPPLAAQILIYPMLDDRNLKPHAPLEVFAGWNAVANTTGWTAYLGEALVNTDKVPITAAPNRATMEELRGLPKTYVDIGELDIFKVEDLEYVTKLAKVDVPLEFHLWPGLPHGFEGLAPGIGSAKLARTRRVMAMKNF